MPFWDVMHGRRNDRSIKASMPHPKCSIWPYFCRKDREINKRPYLGVGVLCARMKTNELNLVDWIKRLSQAILVTHTHFLVRIDAARETLGLLGSLGHFVRLTRTSFASRSLPQSTWLLPYDMHVACACNTCSLIFFQVIQVL